MSEGRETPGPWEVTAPNQYGLVHIAGPDGREGHVATMVSAEDAPLICAAGTVAPALRSAGYDPVRAIEKCADAFDGLVCVDKTFACVNTDDELRKMASDGNSMCAMLIKVREALSAIRADKEKGNG